MKKQGLAFLFLESVEAQQVFFFSAREKTARSVAFWPNRHISHVRILTRRFGSRYARVRFAPPLPEGDGFVC
ncbi:MAG TPA: hypothetical protein VF292_06690 [Rhodanobacteraceae bacterium]